MQRKRSHPRSRKAAFLLAVLSAALARGVAAQQAPWQLQHSGTDAGLRGVYAVGGGVAWASGTNGTVLRTEDSGFVWQTCAIPPGADKLDFRGIWAWDAQTAIVMSSGPGDQSRLYKTTDGCATWKLLYTNPDKDGFWDAIQFWDKDHGLILGDPIEERRFKEPEYKGNAWKGKHFVILQTNDGGATWKWKYTGRGEIPAAGSKGSGAFAASNSSLTVHYPWAWFGIGGPSGASVFLGHDVLEDSGPPFESEGIAWLAKFPVAVPVASGADAAGIFSIAFRDEQKIPYDKRVAKDEQTWLIPAHGIAVGGDYQKPNDPSGTAAWTADGGQTWTAAAKPPHGYRSTVAWDDEAEAWIAAGTNGSDVSYDDGKTWQPLDQASWNALSLPWVVGPHGQIAKLGALPKSQASSPATRGASPPKSR